MKKILITQSNYIPWKGYFDAINQVDEVILYDEAQYTRRDWRNRNVIKTAQGTAWLTIPVQVTGRYFQKISEVKISEKKWNEKHLKTLNANYARAQHFKELKEFTEHLYVNAVMDYLSEINFWFLTEISKWMNVKTPIQFCDSYPAEQKNPTERLVAISKQRGASHYYTGPAAKVYLEEDRFVQENIEVCYLDYDDYPEYPQLFGRFSHNVTILDLLFNTGSNFYSHMKSFS
ncbi:MAG TPA: WbqC family protein [Cyclobacteriaceae bacterium]|nr:WbqC family protein [Cyclobacteriaceae bacterium]